MTVISTPARAPGGSSRQLFLPDVSVGDEIPVVSLPLTLQRLVMEAGVNRDFTPLHHDEQDARLTGAPAPYANTMFIQALIEAALRAWMGDRGRLTELSIQMISFNLVNTVVSAGGVVTAIDPRGDTDGEVCLDVWMRSDETLTVTGTATVSLPRGPGPVGTDGSSGTLKAPEGGRQ